MSSEHLPILPTAREIEPHDDLGESLAAMLLIQAGQEPHDRELTNWVMEVQESIGERSDGIRAAFLRITEPISAEAYKLIERQPASALNEWRAALYVSRYRARLAERLEEVRRDPLFWAIHAETQARHAQWQQISVRELSSQEDRTEIGASIASVRNASSKLYRQELSARLHATKTGIQPVTKEDVLSGVEDTYDETIYQERLQAVATERSQLLEMIKRGTTVLKDIHPNDLFRAYMDHVLAPMESEVIHAARMLAIYRMERVLGIPQYDHKSPRFREWADRGYATEDLRTEYIFDSIPKMFLPYRLPPSLEGVDDVCRLLNQVGLIAIYGLRTPGNKSGLDSAKVIPQDPVSFI